uniref:Rhomboid family protein n=1 Tax=uncultured marine thaumarchaeote KM3_26_F01 TaxID=1456108 RepID=A0A075H0I1_9ARCH|nr:rhomboid family protein [uncultured marine thaumarchaeote KM3_26_F01]
MNEKMRIPGTYILLVINFLFFIILNIILGSTVCGDIPWRMFCIKSDYLFQFAQVNQLIFAGENLYQLITKMFVHIAILHFLLNMISLWFYGIRLEKSSSGLFVILVFLITGISTSITNLFLGTIVSAGASGAIFGIVTTFTVLNWNKKNTKILFLAFIIFIHSPAILGSSINYLSHFTGLACGAILGILKMQSIDKNK